MALSVEFVQPAVQRVDNSTGLPQPPSGLHSSDSKPTVIVHVGSQPQSQPPSGQPAPNIHK